MIGSPSGEIGIAPLMIVRMPISFSTGMRSAAGSAKGSSRSMLGWNSSRPKLARHAGLAEGRVSSSQPPIAKAPGSGLR